MTGVAFGHVLKVKEVDDSKFAAKKDAKDKPEEQKGGVKQIRNSPVNEQARFAKQWVNKMMMDAYGSQRYYNLVPEQHAEFVKQQEENQEFPTTVHLTFEPGFIQALTAETVASMFNEYGDYYLFKDTQDSVFMEFFYLDKSKVRDQTPDSFIKLVKAQPQFHVVEGVLY